MKVTLVAIPLMYAVLPIFAQSVTESWIFEYKSYAEKIDSCLFERKTTLSDNSHIVETFNYWLCDSVKRNTISRFDFNNKLLSKSIYGSDSANEEVLYRYSYDKYGNLSAIRMTSKDIDGRDTIYNSYNSANLLTGYKRISNNGNYLKEREEMFYDEHDKLVRIEHTDEIGAHTRLYKNGLIFQILTNGVPDEEFIYDKEQRLLTHYFKFKFEKWQYKYFDNNLTSIEKYQKTKNEYKLNEKDIYYYNNHRLLDIKTFQRERLVKDLKFFYKNKPK